MSQPSVSVFVRRERSVWKAVAGNCERSAPSASLAVRAVASAALDVPESRITFLEFSPTCVRATVKAPREKLDPMIVWCIAGLIVGVAAIVALCLVANGGAS